MVSIICTVRSAEKSQDYPPQNSGDLNTIIPIPSELLANEILSELSPRDRQAFASASKGHAEIVKKSTDRDKKEGHSQLTHAKITCPSAREIDEILSGLNYDVSENFGIESYGSQFNYIDILFGEFQAIYSLKKYITRV